MGSSPVTATTSSRAAHDLDQALEAFFRRRLEARGHSASPSILVAFSGGLDSSALLAGLVRIAPRLDLQLHAAHFDHRLDADSARRAAAAGRLAEGLGVELVHGRAPDPPRHAPQGREAWARERRYAFLERTAERLRADYIATAHHADDQAETVLLRWAFGSGLAGLGGIQPQLGRVVRPLLAWRRHHLVASLPPGFVAVEDPTNRDLAVPRNRLRHLLLPELESREPGMIERLNRLAEKAAAANRRLDALLDHWLAPRPLPHEPGVAVARRSFEALPAALWPWALAFLHRRAGVAYPPRAAARAELLRQMTAGPGRVGCDCGDGWRWEAASGTLQVVRGEPRALEFAYTLKAPGEVAVPELGLRLRLRRGDVAAWMFSRCNDRAGLADGPWIAEGSRIEVRNRRPGDRVTPLGHRRPRPLKDLLIDRRVPRRQRDRLPILVVEGEIAWVPGITISERFRIARPDPGVLRETRLTSAWIAEIEPLGNPGTVGQRERLEP